MKTWEQIINKVYEQKKARNWNTIYWSIDLHDSVITGKYNRYNVGAELYPYAKEVLDLLFESNLHKTILWTSSHQDAAIKVIETFGLKFHYFNENPEVPDTEMCAFSDKFYFNVLIDDKSGFEGETDWKTIKDVLQKYH